jgi:hypothetical protein
MRLSINLLSYSSRNAAIGSMRAARIAGISDAALATAVSADTEANITHGSRTDVP